MNKVIKSLIYCIFGWGVLCFADVPPAQQPAKYRKIRLQRKAAHQGKAKKLLLKKPPKASAEKKIETGKKGEFTFFTAFPEVGDMDVQGKLLIDGATFYIGVLRAELSKTGPHLVHVGNNNLVGEDGFLLGSKLLKESRCMLGGTGAEYFLKRFEDKNAQDAIYLFPIEGSTVIRKKQQPRTIFYRQPYQKELSVLAEHVVKNCLKDKIAILYESGISGRTLYAELCKTLETYDLKPIVAASYEQGTVEIERALKKITEAGPNAIFCLSKPRPTYKFIKQAVDSGMHAMLFAGPSPLISIQQLLKTVRGVDVVTVSPVPPESSEIPLIKKYKEDFAKRFAFKRSNPFYLESFLCLRLLSKALQEVPQAISQPDLLIKHFESFKNVDFLGVPLTFDPVSRSLATKMWIAPGVDKPWIEVGI